MPFRYRLLSPTGDDLGPFVSGDTSWKPGDVIGRGSAEALVINQVVEPEDFGEIHAYLIVTPQ